MDVGGKWSRLGSDRPRAEIAVNFAAVEQHRKYVAPGRQPDDDCLSRFASPPTNFQQADNSFSKFVIAQKEDVSRCQSVLILSQVHIMT